MAAEGNLWQSTKTRLKEGGFFAQRIETSTAEGVPDVWAGYSDRSTYAWLELKAQREWPVRDATKVFGRDGLQPEQIVWLMNAARCRVRAFVLAGVGTGHKRKTFLVPAELADQFNDMTRPQLMEFECPLDQLTQCLKTAQAGRSVAGKGVG